MHHSSDIVSVAGNKEAKNKSWLCPPGACGLPHMLLQKHAVPPVAAEAALGDFTEMQPNLHHPQLYCRLTAKTYKAGI